MSSTPQTIKIASRPSRTGLLGGIGRTSRYYWVRLLLENPSTQISLAFILTVVVVAALVPYIYPYDPYTVHPAIRLQGPSGAHWFGTDDLGRDTLARALSGARVSLGVGVSVVVLSAFFGSIIGLLSAYYSRLDTPIMRIMDGLMAFPSILLAIAFMASLGPSTVNVVIALAIVYTPRLARVVRGAALTTKQQLYVESARTIGASDIIILWRYIFMNSLSPVIVQSTFVLAYAIISEASLSFLGAGVPPETPTWGNMMREGQRLISRAWWLSVFPGTMLFSMILALNFVGDGLRDALDPRLRGR